VAFAQSVIDILSSEERRRTVGQAGMRLVKGRFDWDIITNTLEGYFKEISGK
jgi:glycosyltransferase involved in cell wall biosynthesis